MGARISALYTRLHSSKPVDRVHSCRRRSDRETERRKDGYEISPEQTLYAHVCLVQSIISRGFFLFFFPPLPTPLFFFSSFLSLLLFFFFPCLFALTPKGLSFFVFFYFFLKCNRADMMKRGEERCVVGLHEKFPLRPSLPPPPPQHLSPSKDEADKITHKRDSSTHSHACTHTHTHTPRTHTHTHTHTYTHTYILCLCLSVSLSLSHTHTHTHTHTHHTHTHTHTHTTQHNTTQHNTTQHTHTHTHTHNTHTHTHTHTSVNRLELQPY